MIGNSKQELVVVFAHGWGLADWFWNPLRESMEPAQELIGSSGYFSEPSQELQAPSRPWVGIGHSLGFQKLAELDLANCRALISLSGFWEFCGAGGTPRRIVQRMLQRFSKQPYEVLQSFYRNCGLVMEPPTCFEKQLLQQDLERLLADGPAEPGKKVSYRGVPVFAISGAQDKIVPCELARTQFANLTLHPAANHSLGFDEPKWCAEHIERILNSL